MNDRFVTAFEKMRYCGNPHKIKAFPGFSDRNDKNDRFSLSHVRARMYYGSYLPVIPVIKRNNQQESLIKQG